MKTKLTKKQIEALERMAAGETWYGFQTGWRWPDKTPVNSMLAKNLWKLKLIDHDYRGGNMRITPAGRELLKRGTTNLAASGIQRRR